MKILFLIGNIAGHGGTERVTCELANIFVASGMDVEILSPFGVRDPYFELSSDVNVTGLSLKEAQGKLGRFMRISHSLYYHCRRAKADVLVVVDSIQFLFCLPWMWWSDSRVVCWEHFNLTTEHGSRFRTLARKAAARWSDAIVVLTERDAEAWRQRFFIDKRVRAIWNPIPRFREEPSAINDRNNAVLAVGRLSEEKGFDSLLRAWRRLGEAQRGWTLRIVGSGNEERALRLLANDLGVAGTVVFVGQTKTIAHEYRAASIYVMSSRWEGLPMTLLEAQYFGLPSVATDCHTGPREILSHGSGSLVPVDDSTALASELANLMGNAELRARRGQVARETARHYAPANIQQSWLRLFDDLIGDK